MISFLFDIVMASFVIFDFLILLLYGKKTEFAIVLTLGLCGVIAFYSLISDLKIAIQSLLTKKHGVSCYGIIREIQATGTSFLGKNEYRAVVQIVLPETKQTIVVKEKMGFGYIKFPVNCYVLCKYYKGDINLEEVIPESQVPKNIKKDLIPIHL